MSATANEEDISRARDWLIVREVPDRWKHMVLASLAAQFAAVRAPLEARIAELERLLSGITVVAATLRPGRPTLPADYAAATSVLALVRERDSAQERIAELEEALDVVNRVNAIATCREKTLREAAAVCVQMPVAHVHRHAWRAAAAAAESVILALIEAPAVPPTCDACNGCGNTEGIPWPGGPWVDCPVCRPAVKP